MFNQLSRRILILFFITLTFSCNSEKKTDNQQSQPPHLRKQGKTTQLIVEDKPFIILGGELGNSSFTSSEYMAPIWPKLKKMNINTVLVPVYWELIEPEEGNFDFEIFKQLITEAKDHDLKLVLLWFASWKNSMSSHVPAWVKRNTERFPRAMDEKGVRQEILTPFSENNLRADMNAFKALMSFVKEVNEKKQTIIMIQVENEIGMLPSARDYCDQATIKFHENVPAELMEYLSGNKEILLPEFKKIWENNGCKTEGSWEKVFGTGTQTDEIFMAWYFAKYTNEIIKAGKEIYPLPMFVNAALNRPGALPGKGYPAGGPLPHLMDIWKAAGPSIDFFSPDIYFPDIKHWGDLYARQNNPIFIPEHRFDATAAAKAAFIIGHYEALGFSPFSVESAGESEIEQLGRMYGLLKQLSPLISSNQGQNRIDGILLDKENQETIMTFGNYECRVKHSYTTGWEANAKNESWESAGAVIVQTGDNEFYIAGNGIVMTFKNTQDTSLITGILSDEEGRFENNEWEIIRHLNGDQTHQGRHIRIFMGDYSIQKLKLYDYKKY